MKILADENIPRLAVVGLRDLGHDVLWIRESFPGISDKAVTTKGIIESRLLITFDKDFGELCYRGGFPAVDGVVLFRPRKAPPDIYVKWVIDTLTGRGDWSGSFSVVEVARIRMNPMPSSEK